MTKDTIGSPLAESGETHLLLHFMD
ncbi:unnamed protein product [Victoria cruziana]